jgi:CYTH domain-containing protein
MLRALLSSAGKEHFPPTVAEACANPTWEHSMAKEIERKYLVKNDGWRAHASSAVPYRQGYLSLTPERTVRVRIAGNKAFITVKGKTEGDARDEFEYPIPVEDAEQMLSELAVKPLIEKTRHVIQDGQAKWEIDEFAGPNRGLIIAEIETSEERAAVHKPDWLGKEVTGDARFYNVNLVQHPFSQWDRQEA